MQAINDKVLVTGAGGFLGRAVCTALAEAGFAVRGMVRPGAGALTNADARIETVRADVLDADSLANAVAGVGSVVHLAAMMSGSAEQKLAVAVDGTRHLMDAMQMVGATRLVLCGSFSVYDWSRIANSVSEQSPVEDACLDKRDGYAIAKTRQEQVVREHAADSGIRYTILRCATIWGPDRLDLPEVGQAVGPMRLVIGPRRRLRLTHVDSAASAFVAALRDESSVGQTVNIVDGAGPTAWAYAQGVMKPQGLAKVCVPVPYAVGRCAGLLCHGLASVFGLGGKVPGILTPRHFEARFKPADATTAGLKGWCPGPTALDGADDAASGRATQAVRSMHG